LDKLIGLVVAALLLVGCSSGDDIGKAPESKVPGPGEGAMKEWANKNPDNGAPGNTEKDVNTP
jgi:hypothetical protein